MPGFSGCHSHMNCFIIAHFTKQNYIRTLTQAGAKRRNIAFCIDIDFTLTDNTLIMSVKKFQWVFQLDDMLALRVVNMVN